MELRHIFRCMTISSSIFTGIQLYFNPSDDKDQLYAWLLNIVGYLFMEFNWPHRLAGHQICIVLQLLSLTFSLSVTSRRSGVNLRFWQRTPEICRLNTETTVWWGTTEGGKEGGGTSWNGYTAGFLCRSRTQQLGRIAEAQKNREDELEKTDCVRSCVRYVDGKWHGYVESAKRGTLLGEVGDCVSAPVFGQCPEQGEDERARIPMQIEWAK